MTRELGIMRQVDVREQWPNEARDFTPWLAAEDNIALLGDALGIELAVEDTEVSVGPYSADILARDTASGDYIVIENQLGKTNHDHLGKAITYGAALNAAAIVWIASDFSDEHKKGLDWLNDNSSGDVAFFGVRLELWRINESPPAVRLNVISRPTEVSPLGGRDRPTKPVSDIKKLQGEFWAAFKAELLKKNVLASAQKTRPQYWYNIPLGRSGIHLSTIVNTFDNKIGIRVYMRAKYNAQSALHQLLEQKEEIEKEVGCSLKWDANKVARDKTIALERKADIRQRDEWAKHLEWLVDMTSRFRQAFVPRVKALELETIGEDIFEREGLEEPVDNRTTP